MAATQVDVASSNAERILTAATVLFAERGIGESGMRAIAAAAGVSVPTVYNHYESKGALVRAVFERHGLGATAIHEAPSFDGSVAERLEAYARWQVRLLRERSEFARLVNRAAATGDPDALAETNDRAAQWVASIRAVLAGATDLRRDIDLDAAAETVKCCLWGIFSVALTKQSFDVDASIEAMLATLPSGLATEPRRVTRRRGR